jgi:hypothetical protein
MPSPYLTKSRFKLAVECPAKLLYTSRNDEYVDTNLNNDLLKGLAEGGFQIGALAQVLLAQEAVGEGVHWEEVTDEKRDDQIKKTKQLLEHENVTIFEATIQIERYLIRIDALRKRGNRFDLIEVKSKSFDSSKQGTNEQEFPRTLKGGMDRDFVPYLQDVAFQAMVLGLAYPKAEIHSYLMLPDKAKPAGVDELHALFPVEYEGGKDRASVKMPKLESLPDLGEPFLEAVCVDAEVNEILTTPLKTNVLGWEGMLDVLAKQWADIYEGRDSITKFPIGSSNCNACQFYEDAPSEGRRSGWHECWASVLKGNALSRKNTVLDLYGDSGGHKKKNLVQEGRYLLSDITKEDLGVTPIDGELTKAQRQWLVISDELSGGGEQYFAQEVFAQERADWVYPYFFLDFEGARTALPFYKGQRPNAINAFQYSLHAMYEDGRVEHVDQFLDLGRDAGMHSRMLRQLKSSLGEQGTVFRWHVYENTLLNEIRRQLLKQENPENDRDELVAFIESLTIRKDKSSKKILHQGARAMVDQADLAARLYYHPYTRGSSSIKKVLPAILRSSAVLRETYGQPIYGGSGSMSSLNYTDQAMTWWQEDPENPGIPLDPYRLLPATFAHRSVTEEQELNMMDMFESVPEDLLKDGSGAMMGYIRQQSGQMPEQDMLDTQAAMLRYCELDTLAMVMIMQEWVSDH